MADSLDLLLQRNSSPRLTEPAPRAEELRLMFRAALRVPDHAWLRPWRFLVVQGDRRHDLGRILLDSLLRRDPDADEAIRSRTLNAALRAPVVIVVLTVLSEHPKVPAVEQRLSAGCAAHAVLLAADALGYGAIWRTGGAAYDPEVVAALGGAENEEIAAFLYVGTRDGSPKRLPELSPDDFVSHW